MGYTCCKTKPFASYVCVNCFGLVHKSCLSRSRSKFRIIEGHLIECCQAREKESAINILETTLREVTEDTQLKTEHIHKLKHDHKIFLEEAVKNETELNEIINKQKTYIDELLLELKQKGQDFGKKKIIEQRTSSTQTNKSSQTTYILETDKKLVEEVQIQKRVINKLHDQIDDLKIQNEELQKK